jgi:hypothetical protein
MLCCIALLFGNIEGKKEEKKERNVGKVDNIWGVFRKSEISIRSHITSNVFYRNVTEFYHFMWPSSL